MFFRWRGPKYTGITCAEGTATQGCDRSADSGAGMAGRSKPPHMKAFRLGKLSRNAFLVLASYPHTRRSTTQECASRQMACGRGRSGPSRIRNSDNRSSKRPVFRFSKWRWIASREALPGRSGNRAINSNRGNCCRWWEHPLRKTILACWTRRQVRVTRQTCVQSS